MNNDTIFQNAVNRLRPLLVRVRARTTVAPYEPGIDERDAVYARYQPIFLPKNLAHLTAREFIGFLDYENNQHWTPLHRQGSIITADMASVRQGLASLLDESKPLAARYDDALKHVRGMGPAIATPILHVVYPDRYGVRNATSEEGIKELGLWPAHARGATEGKRYEKINEILLALATALDIDLWMLDFLWHYLRHEKSAVR